MSLLLLALLAALLLLFGLEFAHLLVPLPLALDVARRVFHVHLLLAPPSKLFLPFPLLAVPLALVFHLLVYQVVHLVDVGLVLFTFLMDLVLLLLELLNALLTKPLLVVGFAMEKLGLGLDELSDSLADEVFGPQLVLEDPDPLHELFLFFVILAALALEPPSQSSCTGTGIVPVYY